MHILRVPIPVGREPPVPQDDGVCPISLHRLASRRRLADDLELEAWVELHGQAVWRIYIYILDRSDRGDIGPCSLNSRSGHQNTNEINGHGQHSQAV